VHGYADTGHVNAIVAGQQDVINQLGPLSGCLLLLLQHEAASSTTNTTAGTTIDIANTASAAISCHLRCCGCDKAATAHNIPRAGKEQHAQHTQHAPVQEKGQVGGRARTG